MTTKLGASLIVGNTSAQFPQTTAQKQIIHDGVTYQARHILNFGETVGSTATSSTPFASYNGLTSLDNSIAAMASSAQRRPGGKVLLILGMAPWWMSGAASPGQANSKPVLSGNITAWADFCAFLANRYAGQVDEMVVWNEPPGKGYWNSTLNRPDYEGYVTMYNAVYSAVKAVQPGIKVGGPYINTHGVLSGAGGAAKGAGYPKTAALDGSFVGVDGVVADGSGWYVDGRYLDFAYYFIHNATGFDFFAFDSHTFQPDNSDMLPASPWTAGTSGTVTLNSGVAVVNDHDKIGKITAWAKARTSAPIYCMETYWGDGGVTFFNAVLSSATVAGLDVMIEWLGPNAGLSDYLWTPNTDTRTAVGDAFVAYTSTPGAPVSNQLIVGAYTNTPPQSTVTSLVLSQWTALKTAVGTGPAANLKVRRAFSSGMPSSLSGIPDASYFAANGIVGFLSVKPSYTAVGSDNAKITSLAASLPAGYYLTAWHEPENDMTAAQYVAMSRNFYSVAKAANPNIYVGNAYMVYQWGTASGRKVTNPDSWWVGSAYTDFLFGDLYMDTWQAASGGTPKTLAADPDFQRWHTWAAAKGKPLGLAEHGVGQGFTDAQRAAYYTDAETWMVANGYRMWLPWNGTGTPPSGEDWDFYGGTSSWPLTLAAYTAILGRGQPDATLNPTSTVSTGFVGSTTTTGNTTSLSMPLPGGLKGGDGLYLWVPYSSPVSGVATTVSTPPVGWTLSGSKSSATSTSGVTGALYYKTAAGTVGAASPDSNTTVTVGVNQITKISMVCVAWRGNTPNPLTVSFGNDPQTSTVTHGPSPTVTPSTPSWVLEFFAGRTITTLNTSYTTPAGTVKRAEVYGTGSSSVDAVVYGTASTVSAGGNHTVTASAASQFEVYASVVLSPTGSGGGIVYSAPAVTDVQTVADPANPLAVTMTVTATDPAGGTLTTTIDWGDGSTRTVSTGTTFTHAYAATGAFAARVTVKSSVSNLTSQVFPQTVLASVNNGMSENLGIPLPQAGMRIVALSKMLREEIIPPIDSYLNTALGGAVAGANIRSQFAYLRAWYAATMAPEAASGTVALTGGNVYWWEMVCQADGAITAIDLEVTTVLAGATGTVLALRDDDGVRLTSVSADTVLGSTGLRRATVTSTPVSRGTVYIVSLYVPASGTVTLRGSAVSATTLALGTSSVHRVAVVGTGSSDPTQITLSSGLATGLPLLALR